MAKQRRSQPSKPTLKSPSSAPSEPAVRRSASDASAAASRPLANPAPAAPQRRSTYFEAVALYERGVEMLQRHEYQHAAETFESVLRQYPEEKELHERVRLY